MRIFPVLAVLLAATACVPQPVAPPSASPAPVPRPAPPPVVATASDWRDWPLTPGTWIYRREAGGSIAIFGLPGGDPRMTLRCDPGSRRLVLSVAASTSAPLTVRTTSVTRQVAVQPAGGNPARVAAALAADDSLLDAMGFSRGHFVIEQAGAATLVVPAWAEIERVTEDCRG